MEPWLLTGLAGYSLVRGGTASVEYYATGWALVGGFGAGSDSMWDVMGAVGYDFNDEVSVAAGYRILGVDYRDNGFAYDIEQSGVMLGAVVEF